MPRHFFAAEVYISVGGRCFYIGRARLFRRRFFQIMQPFFFCLQALELRRILYRFVCVAHQRRICQLSASARCKLLFILNGVLYLVHYVRHAFIFKRIFNEMQHSFFGRVFPLFAFRQHSQFYVYIRYTRHSLVQLRVLQIVRKAAALFAPRVAVRARLCAAVVYLPHPRAAAVPCQVRFAPYRLRVLSLGFQLLRTRDLLRVRGAHKAVFLPRNASRLATQQVHQRALRFVQHGPLAAAQTDGDAVFQPAHKVQKGFHQPPVALHRAHQLFRVRHKLLRKPQAYFLVQRRRVDIPLCVQQPRARRAVRA